MTVLYQLTLKWLSEARAQDKNIQYYCRVLFFLIFIQLCDSRKIHYLTREFHVKLHLKTDIGFRVQFNVGFPRQVMNFPIVLRAVDKDSCSPLRIRVVSSAYWLILISVTNSDTFNARVSPN